MNLFLTNTGVFLAKFQENGVQDLNLIESLLAGECFVSSPFYRLQDGFDIDGVEAQLQLSIQVNGEERTRPFQSGVAMAENRRKSFRSLLQRHDSNHFDR